MDVHSRAIFDAASRAFADWFSETFQQLEDAFGPPPSPGTVNLWARKATGYVVRDVERAIGWLVDNWKPEFGRKWPVPADFREALPVYNPPEADVEAADLLLSAARDRRGFDALPPEVAEAVGGPSGWESFRALVEDGRAGTAHRRVLLRQRKVRALRGELPSAAPRRALPSPDRSEQFGRLAETVEGTRPRALPPKVQALLAPIAKEPETRAKERPPGWVDAQKRALRERFPGEESKASTGW